MKLTKKLGDVLDLIKGYKEISREEIEKKLNISNKNTTKNRIHNLRKLGFNIQSLPTGEKRNRVYKIPDTSKDLNYVVNYRELNGKTHINNWKKNIVELVKKNPKLNKEIFQEQQSQLLDAITISNETKN